MPRPRIGDRPVLNQPADDSVLLVLLDEADRGLVCGEELLRVRAECVPGWVPKYEIEPARPAEVTSVLQIDLENLALLTLVWVTLRERLFVRGGV